MEKLSFVLSDRDEGMKLIEDLTKNAKQIQDKVLEEILTSNKNTEYLTRFLHGKCDKQLFKKNVPIVKYEDVKPYIERIVNGEPSDVISARPIDGFFLSSGTSGGAQKMIPWNNKYFDDFKFVHDLRMFTISKLVDGVEKGKGVMFSFCRPGFTTPSGLPAFPVTTFYMHSNYFKNAPSNWYDSYTSPLEVFHCLDNKQTLYCHLLCGLVQRDQVTRVGSSYASVFVRAIKYLEEFWTELCLNIRSGYISDWITDLDCKNSTSLVLGKARPELADAIEHECDQKSWKGVIKRLWPKAIFVEAIVTGSMAQYVPVLEFYCDGLPIVSRTYASSESKLGLNLDPLCKPEDVSYTFMPNLSYFEFLSMDNEGEGIVDLVDVKLGRYYELVVTNFFGLYRMRVGDVLLVTGFYNNAPQFRFARRENAVLSVHAEKTNEEDLFRAVSQAKLSLQSSALMLIDFTSYVDTTTAPGHYVFYWELKATRKHDISEIDPTVIAECCFVVEESLDAQYKRYRSEDGMIGALEIRVVQQGTFDALMDFFISQGSSINQYKTPRCINSMKALELMEKRVVERFFSNKDPSCEPYKGST